MLRAENFTGTDTLRIPEFLQNFRGSANHNDVSEAAAARLMPYFLDNPAAAEVKAQLTHWEHDHELPLYPRLVAWLLKEYATPRVLRDAYQSVVTLMQGAAESEHSFATRIKAAAARAGNVLTDKALSNVYLDGLRPGVSSLVTELKKPGMTLTDLITLETNMGQALSRPGQPHAARDDRYRPTPAGFRPMRAGARTPTLRVAPTARPSSGVNLVDQTEEYPDSSDYPSAQPDYDEDDGDAFQVHNGGLAKSAGTA